MGSGAYGVFVEITRKYKITFLLQCGLTALSILGLGYCLTTENLAAVSIFAFIVGFNIVPMMVVGYEFGVEITYPLGEMMSSGLLQSFSNVLGVIYVRSED